MFLVVAHRDSADTRLMRSAACVIAESRSTGGVLGRQLNVLEFVYIRRLALCRNVLRVNPLPAEPESTRLAMKEVLAIGLDAVRKQQLLPRR